MAQTAMTVRMDNQQKEVKPQSSRLMKSMKKSEKSDDQICTVIELVKQNGIDSSRFPYAGEMPDEDDRVFYEVCLSKEDSFLVTGNLKHFPKEPQVITAAEMMEILDNEL